VHRLLGHSVAPLDLDHRSALEDLKHGPIPLLHHIQLHQHDRLLPDDHEMPIAVGSANRLVRSGKTAHDGHS
jgi:hypothetical protein